MPTGHVSQTAVAALRLVPGRQAGVGAVVGEGVGVKVGEGVGPPVGSPVGLCVGVAVGDGVGVVVGISTHSVTPVIESTVHFPCAQATHSWYAVAFWYLPVGQ